MNLTDKLTQIAKEAKAIRESMVIQDPRSADFNPSFGMSSRDRLVAAKNSPQWASRVAEVANLFSDVFKGRRPDWHLKEAMSTSDFPLLFGDLLYRQLLGQYAPYPVTYPSYFKIMEVADFRKLNMYTIDGGQGLLEKVAEYAPYPETKFVEGRRQISVTKYGRRYGISFEMLINDDLNAFNDRPALMAVGARRSEEYLATTMIFDVNGPHAGFFTVGNANIIPSNPPLSVAGLQTGFERLAAMKDSDGQPIVIDAATLLVTPNDMVRAQNILNATQLQISDGGGAMSSASTWLFTQNWMKSKVSLAVNPYIPYIVTGTHATSNPWCLIASPNDPSRRPAFVFAFLRGRRAPQLFMQDPDQMDLGGGEVGPLEGNFANDAINYKLRHIFGAAQGDPKLAVASDGSGSA